MSVVEAKLRTVNLEDDACIERARGRVARRDMARGDGEEVGAIRR